MTTNLRPIGQRLKEYMQLRGLTIATVAHMSPLSVKDLDAIIDGEPYPISHLMILLDLFEDVNPRWLLHGDAPMLHRGNPRPPRQYRDELEAREILNRQAPAVATTSKGELREEVEALRQEVAGLRQLVQAQEARLRELETKA